MSPFRSLLVVALMLAVSLGAAQVALAQPDSTDESSSFTSPAYGFVIPLDGGWTVSGTINEGVVELHTLENGPLTAYVMTFASSQIPAQCVEQMIGTIGELEGVSDVALAGDVETDADSAFGVIRYTVAGASGVPDQMRDRVNCWSFPASGLLVRLEVIVPADIALANLANMVAFEEALAASLASQPPVAQTSKPIGPTPTATAPSAQPPPPASPVPTETAEPSGQQVPGPGAYTSPTFGYGLSWDASWTLNREVSNDAGDFLTLENDAGVIANLVGEQAPSPTGTCFDWVVEFYQLDPDLSDIRSAADDPSASPGLWDMTGVVTMTQTNPVTAEVVDLVSYVACSELPDQGAVVTLEFIVKIADFPDQAAAMDSLREAFVPAGQALPPQEPGSAVTGNSYLSPSYGYSLSWDEGWSVDEENTSPGTDFLQLTNGVVLANLLSEEWDPSTGTCFEWSVDFYTNSPDFTEVEAVENITSKAPGIWDRTGAIAMMLNDVDTGELTPLIIYVSCSEIPGTNAIVSLEQAVSPGEAPGQLEHMDELRAGFAIGELPSGG